MATEVLTTDSSLVPELLKTVGSDVTLAHEFFIIDTNLTFDWDSSTRQMVITNATGQDITYTLQGVAAQSGVQTQLYISGEVTQGAASTFYLNGSATSNTAMDMTSNGDSVWVSMGMSTPSGLKKIFLSVSVLDGDSIPFISMYPVTLT